MENVKEYLNNIKDYVGLKNAYNEQLLQIRLIGYTAPISNYSNIGGSNGTRGDSIQERYMLALEKLETEMKEKIVEYTDAISNFHIEVNKIRNARYRLVLIAHYSNNKSIKDIARELDTSESSIKKTLHLAREKFAEIYQV
jgi:DNA-binding CsgD family transcriptional regulator